MASCQRASQLFSDSLERRLKWWERLDLTVHHGICTACRKYRRQVILLRRLLREAGARLERAVGSAGDRLSDDARQRIRAAIDRAAPPQRS